MQVSTPAAAAAVQRALMLHECIDSEHVDQKQLNLLIPPI